jgi:hypothetical protein
MALARVVRASSEPAATLNPYEAQSRLVAETFCDIQPMDTATRGGESD